MRTPSQGVWVQSEAEFIIDGRAYRVDIGGSPAFSYGKAQTLSSRQSDVTFDQPWYERGYGIIEFLGNSEFAALKTGISRSISGIVGSLGIDSSGFELEKYHDYVGADASHLQVVGLTRDLFPEDFNFPIAHIIPKLERLLGFGLTDIDPDAGQQLHIIVRINRPHSNDFNPPHKDVYEAWDAEAIVQKFVNFWIPICGVSSQSSLPLVPASHLIPEDRIYRTFSGGVVGGRQYRVRNILRWDDSNEMHRPPVGYGEVLIFSPHLIHGCAVNSQDDITRVALEFRLFRKS